MSLRAPGCSRFVTADGTELNVRHDGELATEPTLVLLHGWTQDRTCWDRVVSDLGPAVRVLRYDHRGHGSSAPAGPDTATLETLADDLAELLTLRVPEGPLVLAGHSMGGMTIMAAAERHPELLQRVAGLALVSTTSGGLARATFGLPAPLARGVPRVNRRVACSRRSAVTVHPRALQPVLRRVFDEHPRRVDVTDAARQAAHCHPASLAGMLDSSLEHERTAVLPTLCKRPCVIMVGTRDPLTPRSHAATLAEALPSARYVRFTGAGHMLPVERDAEVAAEIAGLLGWVWQR
jgi:pimeloyl-ACP methyl ester carboxylesterase